jgi:hypothetical protein
VAWQVYGILCSRVQEGGWVGVWFLCSRGAGEGAERRALLYPVECNAFLKSHVCPLDSWLYQSRVKKENVGLRYGV